MSALRQAFRLLQQPVLAASRSSLAIHNVFRFHNLPPYNLCKHTRTFSSSLWWSQGDSSPPAPRAVDQASQPASDRSGVTSSQPQTRITLEPPEPKLSLTFTCTVEDCGHRSTHQFTKRSYTQGIVLVQCPGCKNRHLIADHMGWFKESTEDGKLRTVEDLLRAKGEKVRRGRIDAGGVVEYAPE